MARFACGISPVQSTEESTRDVVFQRESLMRRLLLVSLILTPLCGCTGNPGKESVPDAAPAAIGAQPQSEPPGATISPTYSASPPVAPGAAATVVDKQQKRSLDSILSGAAMEIIWEDPQSTRLYDSLWPIREQFPLLRHSTQAGHPEWNHLTLDQMQKKFDAVRFRCPEDGPRTLALCFTSAGALPRWSMLPAERVWNQMSNWHVEWNVTLPGKKLAQENTLVFHAGTTPLTPGAEYLLWFFRPEKEPWEVDVSISLLPPESLANAKNARSIAQAMGIDYQAPQFSAEPDGVRRALEFAHSLWKRRAAGNDRFNDALRAATAGLPEVTVGHEGQIAWNKVTLNQSGTGLDAYRFRSPLAAEGNLQYIVGEPRGQYISLNLIPPQGRFQMSEPKLEVDLKLEGVDLPPTNVTYMQLVPNAQFKPDADHIVWIATSQPERTQTVLGLHASPDGPVADPLTTRFLASIAGVKIPETISTERLIETRRMCRQWCVERGAVENVLLRNGLQSIASALPEIQVSTGDADAVWNTVPLNVDGVAFDAVRFKSPLKERTAIFCAFGDSHELVWQCITTEGSGGRFNNIQNVDGVRFAGAELPPESQFTLGAETTHWWFKQIVPGEDYILWFQSPVDKPRRDLRLAVRLIASTENEWFRSGREIATRMGLRVEPPPASPGSIRVGQHDTAIVGAGFSSDGRLLASLDRKGVLRLWNAAGSGFEREFRADGVGVGKTLEISPDGQRIAIGYSEPSTVIIQELISGKPIARFKTGAYYLDDIAFSPDGMQLVVCDGNRVGAMEATANLSVWKTDGTKLISKSIFGPSYESLQWAGDQHILGAGSHVKSREGIAVNLAGVFTSFDPRTLEAISDSRHPAARFMDLAFSSESDRVAAAGIGHTVNLWVHSELRELPPFRVLGTSDVIAFSRDGKFLAVGAEMPLVESKDERPQSSVQYWEMKTGRLKFERIAHDGKIARIAVSPDGRWIATAGEDQAIYLWDSTFPECLAQTNSLGMKLGRIPAGALAMGASRNEYGANLKDEVPRHRVIISRPFDMGMHEVTVGQFRRFVEASGYKTTAESNSQGGAHILDTSVGFQNRPELTWRAPGFEQTDDHPVVQISWNDAREFCHWLSREEGAHYRLPTEAEWEYACRGGSAGGWSFSDFSSQLPSFANLADLAILDKYRTYETAVRNWNDRFPFSAPIGSFCANPFGLYDMHGNAMEWCSDWYDSSYYHHSPELDPQGPSAGVHRVQRGGSFLHDYTRSRSARRDFDVPTSAQSCGGFRVLREVH